jgi:hypothetical protein
MRKLKHWAGTRAKNWFASQYQAPLTPGSLASNLDLLKNKLTQRFSFQLSRQINQVYDLYIKSGVACGVLVSALTLFVVRLLANRIEYRTTLLAFHFHYVIDGINPLKSIKRVHQLGSIFNTLSSLQYAYSFILALQQVENFRPILARLNLLSSEEMQQIDPQAIEGLTVNHIQTLTRIPQENLTLPIDTLLQKIPGSLLKRQYEILAHNQLTPLIEKVASFLAPRVTRLFGYTRV